MGTLERTDDPGDRVLLGGREVIGRASSCTLIVDHPKVSSVHACIEWRSSRWVIRDLGSRNGTFVDGKRLPNGQDTALARGQTVAVGAVRSWTLVDDSPPTAFAVPVSTAAKQGEETRRPVVRSADGVMSLPPGTDKPAVVVARDAEGAWLVGRAGGQRERAKGGQRSVRDGDLVVAGDDVYRIRLPNVDHTSQSQDSAALLQWRFVVSRDEEHVALTICTVTNRHEIAPRAYLYTLLTLARIRARDEANPELPVSSRGWINQDELLDMLQYSGTRLHTDLYRARQQFRELGLKGASEVVERRPRAQQLRFAYPDIVIETV